MKKTNTNNWNIQTLLEATGGMLTNGELNCRFSNISIDSRQINKQDLFIAIIGDMFDGHNFIEDVIKKGVKGIIVQENVVNKIIRNIVKEYNINCITVCDTVKALGDIALYHRKHMPATVVGITGSNGKTTVKELTSRILEQNAFTLKNPGNLNNHIGVPLTLLKLQSCHKWSIVEMGMNHIGEIDY